MKAKIKSTGEVLDMAWDGSTLILDGVRLRPVTNLDKDKTEALFWKLDKLREQLFKWTIYREQYQMVKDRFFSMFPKLPE